MTIDEVIARCTKQSGWCTTEKMMRMYYLVREASEKFPDHPIFTSIEVGVWYGRSLLPLGFAHKSIDRGFSIGIDAYDPQASIVGSNSPENNEWWLNVNYDEASKSVYEAIIRNELSNYCSLVEMQSDDASTMFKKNSIHVFHLDGNHSSEAIVNDLKMWTPKIAAGGFLIADDCDWHEAKKGYAELSSMGYVMYEDYSKWQIWIKK